MTLWFFALQKEKVPTSLTFDLALWDLMYFETMHANIFLFV